MTGEIFLNGKQIENKTPKQAMKNGIGFITRRPESRRADAGREHYEKYFYLANLKRISRHGGDPERERKRAGTKRGSRSYISGVLDRSMNVIT